MARIILASYLESMSGLLGNVVYYRRYGREYARLHVTPANPDTMAQRAIRGTFGDAVRSWQTLSEEERERWNRQARRLPMSGYNLYISRYMRQHIPPAANPGACRKAGREPIPSCMHSLPSVCPPYQPINRSHTPPL